MTWFIITYLHNSLSKRERKSQLVNGEDPKELIKAMIALNANKKIDTTDYFAINLDAVLKEEEYTLMKCIEKEAEMLEEED